MGPVLILAAAVTLILSQLLYALPRRGGSYPAVLALTAAGIGLGQLWRWLDLPGIGIGELNLVPGVLFAGALRPLAARLPIRWPQRRRRGDGRAPSPPEV